MFALKFYARCWRFLRCIYCVACVVKIFNILPVLDVPCLCPPCPLLTKSGWARAPPPLRALWFRHLCSQCIPIEASGPHPYRNIIVACCCMIICCEMILIELVLLTHHSACVDWIENLLRTFYCTVIDLKKPGIS